MIRRHVLAALDAGIAAGDEDAARASLARIDWLLRRRARRRLERVLIDAALVSGELAPGDVEGERHVQRVAALALRGTPAAEPADRAAVAAAYASVAAPRPSRAPTATIAGALVFVTAGGAPRRVVSLRRIDHLNLVHTVLGMHSEELADPMLLLDQIDQHVATQVMPVLAPEAAFPLADTPWSATTTARQLAAAAGAAIRAELRSALGADASAATRIAALLHERADLVESWRDTLERHHLRMIATDELFLPAGLLDQLEGLVPRYQRERVAAIEGELASLDGPRIASRCHALVSATVRRHEAEHGFDADRPAPLRYPPALEAETGDVDDRNGEPRWLVLHARNELSAWLSQIANDPTIPALVTWDLAGHAFSRPRWGTPESYVAVVVLEGLARHLGGGDHAPVIHDGAIDRDRLAAVTTPIARASNTALRAAASALWTELYGEPLTVITDR